VYHVLVEPDAFTLSKLLDVQFFALRSLQPPRIAAGLCLQLEENVDILEHILDGLSLAGITIIVSSHDVDFAYRFAERAIIFSCGEVIADANIDEVFESESVLLKAGLKKPLLYAAAECLEHRYPQMKEKRKPRSMEEFRSFMDRFS